MVVLVQSLDFGLAHVLGIDELIARALQGRKSGLSACGSCKSCAPPADASKPTASNRVAFLPAEMLIKRK